MLELTRFTTSFSETEDRIQLSGTSDDGQTWTLWLTQRLLNRLIPHLCKQIGPREPDERATLISSFEQMAAVQNIKPLPPVEKAATGTAFNVQAVRTEVAKGVVRIILKEREDGGGCFASITLREEPLRQWLAILYGQYQKADWSLNPWPAWIGAQAQLSAAQETLLN